MIAAATMEALDIVEQSPELRETLFDNARYFREKMAALGFELVPGEHAIVPVMLNDAVLAQKFAKRMLELGVYVTAFAFPVVPKGWRGFAHRCRRRTRQQTWIGRLPPLNRLAKNWGVI